MEGGGFEPPKAEPADLQSAPFGHSGTPPKRKPAILGPWSLFVNRPLAALPTSHHNDRYVPGVNPKRLPPPEQGRNFNNGAGERIRTPDRLITNQLLYRLSYASTGLPLEGAYSSSLSGATLTCSFALMAACVAQRCLRVESRKGHVTIGKPERQQGSSRQDRISLTDQRGERQDIRATSISAFSETSFLPGGSSPSGHCTSTQ